MTHSRLLHLRALLIPLTATLFFVVQPANPIVAALFAISPFFPPFPRDSDRVETVTCGGMNALVLALFALQCVNLPLAAAMVAREGWLSVHTLVALVLTGVSSCLCGAIAGHELVHWKRPGLGRFLLATVLYEHFYAEHLRGHHVRYATREDPATARLNETFWAYLRRSPVGQLTSAWKLDRKSVLQGFAVEALLIGAFGWFFGAAGAAFFVLQALAVHVIFNAVQYFEHWGLEGRGGAWDAEDRASLFGMIGLARHADHHARPGRPFDELEARSDSPRLPASYGGMIWLAIFQNREFQLRMRQQLGLHADPEASEWMRAPDCS